ncbi:hypothetical protein CROQUDRAFT_134865 [Cronartium quercuum f. sp. fusiforme G11]|uniref:VLRF1 domain-containing protein n=1 Tax=Cronartium quercuum f. sp. fusiforme G11 TaxID=708437 RepID=A0A9P6NHC2_9BASI|nr:hypothetical protein CROQUDRAFT_134865 [Cronartium quercuum f. sp. fusiforme G11]
MVSHDAKSQIQAWGELYAFDLPKDLRGALWMCSSNDAHQEIERLFPNTAEQIRTPHETTDEQVETSESIWTDDSKWHIRPTVFEQHCRFEIYRSILPQSSGRDSGALSKKPLKELRRLQHHADLKGRNGEKRLSRTWTLIIIGTDEMAVMQVQTDLGESDDGKSIEDRMVILRHEIFNFRTEPLIEGSSRHHRGRGNLKNAKGKALAKMLRKSQRGVETDPKVKTVNEVLRSWSAQLCESELIFIGANRKQVSIHFPESSAAYRKLRPFPFALGTPSLGELKRCFVKLTTAQIKVGL